MHQSVDLFFRALEVVDGEGIYRDEFDPEGRTYFQNLLQRDNAINVPLQNLHAIYPGMPSISIHDECNVLWYRACSKNGAASGTEEVNGLVAQPVRG